MEKLKNNLAMVWIEKDGEKIYKVMYKELESDADGLRFSLISRGMQDRSIAIIGDNSYEWVVSFLAVKGGAGKAVLLDKELFISDMKLFLIKSECCCAIFPGELEGLLWQIRNDGVTQVETLINMNKEESDNSLDILSLRELINEGNQSTVSL
jgi:long-chain acyl-CoA synthetase